MGEDRQLYVCPDCKSKLEKMYFSNCSSCGSEICCYCKHTYPHLPSDWSVLCRQCHSWLCKEVKRLLKEDVYVQKKK